MDAILVKIFATALTLGQILTQPDAVKTEFDPAVDQPQGTPRAGRPRLWLLRLTMTAALVTTNVSGVVVVYCLAALVVPLPQVTAPAYWTPPLFQDVLLTR